LDVAIFVVTALDGENKLGGRNFTVQRLQFGRFGYDSQLAVRIWRVSVRFFRRAAFRWRI